VLEVNASEPALDFVGRERSAELSQVGARVSGSPGVHTKAKPLFLEPGQDLDEQVDAYEAWYRSY